MSKLTIKMEMPSLEDIKKLSMRKFIAGQNILTEECKKFSDKYTPKSPAINLMREFEWDKDTKTGAVIGWTYLVPYANRQWHGLTEEGEPFNYSKDVNPQAQSRWTEKAAIEHRPEIMAAVIKAIKNG